VRATVWLVDVQSGQPCRSQQGSAVEPVLISVKEAAKALSLGRTTVYELINDGQLETVKLGSRRLVKVASMRRLIDAAS
jgi:excisionase family DNA binding protein